MVDSKKVGRIPGADERKQQRSRRTRRELLDAARRVFARDGFELARLQEIATLAGKTRGAFYDHFKDKEDVFFAIFEEDLARDEQRLNKRMRSAAGHEERFEAIVDHLAGLAEDRSRLLLYIEFKLYAIRQPKHWKRLAQLHQAMCMRCAQTHIDELVPESGRLSLARKRRRAGVLGAVIDGLTLNLLFYPAGITRQQARTLISAALRVALQS